jgi:hypothetical protein
LHRIVEKNALWAWVARAIETRPRVYGAFTALEERTKSAIFGCQMCGQCALPLTGYACPMTCPKQLRNGPCGGVGADGACEVYPAQRCVWVQAYERTSAAGRTADLLQLQRPIDHRRRGESSWVNYWSGRDDDLATPVEIGRQRPAIRQGAAGGPL